MVVEVSVSDTQESKLMERCAPGWTGWIFYLFNFGFQMVRFSKGQALAMAKAIVPNHSKTRPFKIQMFLSGF